MITCLLHFVGLQTYRAVGDRFRQMTLMNSPLNVALGNKVIPMPAPELGSAIDDVYGELLGIAAPELATLKAEGVI